MQPHARRTTSLGLETLIFLAIIIGMQMDALAADQKNETATSPQLAAEAKTLRDKALDAFKKKEYARSIEFYQKALTMERKVGAMAQMASALNELGRYDEALRWYETALQEFPNALATTRKKITTERDELLSKVGTIAVEGDIVEGLRLFIDNRDVGPLPLEAPIRVLGGMHEVRAVKSGFAPIVTSVEVTAGQPSVAKLVAKDRQAKLEIREKHNWMLRVELDGQDIGLSPISKIVETGEHRIRLRGYMRPEALLACETPEQAVELGARMESEEKIIQVGLFETQNIELSAEDMDASLRIDATPKGASVWIDGHDAGKTPWEGRLPLGEHAIEVRANGFYMAKQSVLLERRKPKDIAVVLQREPDRTAEERAIRNQKLTVAIAYGVGGIGLGMFGVAGGLALRDRAILQTNCVNGQCPSTEDARVQQMRTLGTISTIGMVITGVGVAAGTTLFFLNRREEHKRHVLQMGVGLTSVDIRGSF
jgi:tetratricopeptide (TPR) repeat protein